MPDTSGRYEVRLYRRLLGELRAEGWAYVYGTTPYSKDSEFKLFVERSEAAMRRYDEAYVSEVSCSAWRARG